MNAPYRLDLTVAALQRVRANLVDVMAENGVYMRAFAGEHGPVVVEVSQCKGDALDVCMSGPGAERYLETVATMLAANVDLSEWHRRVRPFPWLALLARRLRGLGPPRYPELWESLCHGIIFQQLSIAAGASIMQRFVRRFSEPVAHGAAALYPFPRPQAVARARDATLREIGLSRMKASYLKDAAKSVIANRLDAASIESLPSDRAAVLLQALRGIGTWSAAVVLLRGFGRLDVFPPGDSGASQNIKLLSCDPGIDLDKTLAALGRVRGMLYFHLLLARRQRFVGESSVRRSRGRS